MPLLTLFLIGAASTYLLTGFVIRLAKKFGFVDSPTRSHPAILHKKPLPRAGGLGIFLGICLSLLTLFVTDTVGFDKHLVGILLAGFLLVVVGLADDRYDLNPYFRLFTNIAAVLIVVGAGIGIKSFTNPLGGQILLDSWRISFVLPGSLPLLSGIHSIVVWADLFALVWIVWIMNALNWSSGIDGQLSGIAAISLATVGFVSLRSISSDQTQVLTAALAFSASGAYLGFLPWSFYPQKIMPGYGGSTLAGFLLATLAILSGAKLATAALVLAVPIIDGVWAIVRRLWKHRSPVWGDKEHLHHQLLKRGWSIPKITFFYYFITASLGLFALGLDSKGKLFAIAVSAIVLMGFLLTLRRVSPSHG